MKPATALRTAIIIEWLLVLSCAVQFVVQNLAASPLVYCYLATVVVASIALFLLKRWGVYFYIGANLSRMFAVLDLPELSASTLLEIREVLGWFIFGAIVFLVFGAQVGKAKKST